MKSKDSISTLTSEKQVICCVSSPIPMRNCFRLNLKLRETFTFFSEAAPSLFLRPGLSPAVEKRRVDGHISEFWEDAIIPRVQKNHE